MSVLKCKCTTQPSISSNGVLYLTLAVWWSVFIIMMPRVYSITVPLKCRRCYLPALLLHCLIGKSLGCPSCAFGSLPLKSKWPLIFDDDYIILSELEVRHRRQREGKLFLEMTFLGCPHEMLDVITVVKALVKSTETVETHLQSTFNVPLFIIPLVVGSML